MQLLKSKGFTYIILILVIIMCLFFPADSIFEGLSGYKVSPKGRKILMIYVGGTIGMESSPDGYRPQKGYLEKQLKRILDLHPKHKDKIAPYDILEYKPLLDSSNMSIEDWNKMIETIRKHYADYDAFIIVHGTDTMAYSASALSFSLQNLKKPVIFTGSQIPLERIINDGEENLLCSLIVATNYDIPEVIIIFGNSIMRGNRTVKISANKLHAFSSPNFDEIGAFGYSPLPQIDTTLIKTTMGTYNQGYGNLDVHLYKMNVEVITFFLTPGANFNNVADIIRNNSQVKGVILQTFGIGDGPVGNKKFLHLLQYLKDNDIVVINVSQCIEGRVDQGDYVTGSTLKKYDIISGKDLTFDAAYCKLLFLLSRYGNNTDLIRQLMTTNLAGELSDNLALLDTTTTTSI